MRWQERAKMHAQKTQNRGIESEYLISKGLEAKIKGDWSSAKKAYEQALALAIELDNQSLIARLHNNLGNIAKNRKSYIEARRHFQKALYITQIIGDRETEARCYNGLGNVAREQQHYEDALCWYEKALRLKKELGDASGIAKCYVGLGNVAQGMGDTSEALNYYQQAVEENPDDKISLSICYQNMAIIKYKQGEVGEARTLLWRSFCLKKELGLPIPEWIRREVYN